MKRIIPQWILNHSRFQYVYQKWLATPVWVDQKEIDWWYERAKLRTQSTGIEYVVDHIVPLNSPYVCGLNWHANMQLLTKAQNAHKGNRYWPDMWNEQTDVADHVEIPGWLKTGQMELNLK
jgi:hypothetical protein